MPVHSEITPEIKEALKTRIEGLIAETQELIAEYKAASAPVVPENSIGRISRMDAIGNKAVTENALTQSLSRLNRLNNARLRLETGDFGFCTRCKTEIPLGRLQALPESARCVQCASR